MVGDYEGAAVVPGGNAYSAFAVGGIPSGSQRFNEAMSGPAALRSPAEPARPARPVSAGT
jgi:hypothetical protein